MKHIMLDLETLGTDSNAVVVSISAVEFDLDTGKQGSDIEIGLNLLEQALNGGIIDTSTLSWWSSQSAKAKSSLLRIPVLSIDDALDKFNTWIESIDHDLKDIKLWGNGATADNVWVRNLYRRHNIDFVLPYWCDCDVRTLVTISGISTRDYKFTGLKHNGIHDCLHQIKYCTDAYNKLG